MFFKIGVFWNFTVFTGKHLCWSLFLIRLHAWRPTVLLKRCTSAGFFLEYYKIFKNCFFVEYPWWLLLAIVKTCIDDASYNSYFLRLSHNFFSRLNVFNQGVIIVYKLVGNLRKLLDSIAFHTVASWSRFKI